MDRLHNSNIPVCRFKDGKEKCRIVICVKSISILKVKKEILYSLFLMESEVRKNLFSGHQVSYFLKQTFLSVLINSELYIQENYDQALKYTFQKLDQLILSQRGEKRLKQIRVQHQEQVSIESQIISDTSGSTALVILVTKKKIFIAYNGQFKVFLMKNQKPILITQSLNPQKMQEKLRIEKAGGSVVKGRINGDLNFSRTFGLNSFKKNSELSWEQQMVTSCPLIKVYDKSISDDYFFLGNEGFWENYQNNQNELLKQIQQLSTENKGNLSEILTKILDNTVPSEIKEENNLGYKNMNLGLIKFNEI